MKNKTLPRKRLYVAIRWLRLDPYDDRGSGQDLETRYFNSRTHEWDKCTPEDAHVFWTTTEAMRAIIYAGVERTVVVDNVALVRCQKVGEKFVDKGPI